ncbi:MAG: 2-oxoisovalerate dehydrogenase, partial [Planctomycetes bacterium]|nr:2-oxoisovalerate dehydrogenase [Planctomycetota bacterium]
MAGGERSDSTIDELELLKLMYLSREGDRREGVLLRQSKGWFQVAGMGHETLAVIALLMQENDYLFPYYRDRAMVLARGVTNRELALAYYAKRESSSGGRQMPGHYSSRSHNIWSVPTPTASNLLPACGVAWGMQLNGDPHVVVATTGDAATRQGEFYEAVAFAVERQLPIVFVVEDNRYGISTNTDHQNPFKLGIFNEDMGVRQIDARRPENVRDAATKALSKARTGSGPTILVCELDRLCSHTSSDDHRVYRQADEIAEMMTRDPIAVLAAELIASGEIESDEWDRLKKEIDEQVDREYLEAEDAVDPQPGELLDQLQADPLIAEPPTLEGGKRWRMVDAVNQVFKHGLETDSRYVFFGEDIEDPKGGVFGLTSGLSQAFPERVFNAPLAEATIAGVACGLAGYGMRPVFEMQFVDFINPGWNQIAQNRAT